MALRYVIKKKPVGIGTNKVEKYVAQSVSVGEVNYKTLCEQVTKEGLMPRGVVKSVIDGLVDVLCTYVSMGITVRLDDFGTIRPGLNGYSQDEAEDVKANVIYRRKMVFVPSARLKEMIKKAGVIRLDVDSEEVTANTKPGTGGEENTGGGENAGEGGESYG
jgi:predicted histone-like DNA-binding protein